MDKRKNRSKIIIIATLALAFGLPRLPWREIFQVVTGISRRHAEGVESARKSCDLGDGSGCFILGYFYGEGYYGGDRAAAEAKAVELYRKSCDLDDSMGCFSLGGAYASASGVGRNLAKAAELLRKSCDNVDGYMWACTNLSRAYELGEGIPKSHAKSVEYARKAAELYHKPSKNKTMSKLESILEP